MEQRLIISTIIACQLNMPASCIDFSLKDHCYIEYIDICRTFERESVEMSATKNKCVRVKPCRYRFRSEFCIAPQWPLDQIRRITQKRIGFSYTHERTNGRKNMGGGGWGMGDEGLRERGGGRGGVWIRNRYISSKARVSVRVLDGVAHTDNPQKKKPETQRNPKETQNPNKSNLKKPNKTLKRKP